MFESLYSELHRLARQQLRGQRALSLGATTLLHEAYLDLSARDPLRFADRARFMAYASRAMRGLIIDYARNRKAQKRGGGFELTSYETDIIAADADDRRLTAIGDTLDALARVEPALAELVDLKFFCGLSIAEIAALRSVSERTVQRDWQKARLYLYRALDDATS